MFCSPLNSTFKASFSTFSFHICFSPRTTYSGKYRLYITEKDSNGRLKSCYSLIYIQGQTSIMPDHPALEHLKTQPAFYKSSGPL